MIRRLRSFLEPKSDNQKKLNSHLTQICGFRPLNAGLYELALTHRSASVRLDNGEVINNERLEYLGDAILDAVISEYLFTTYPGKDEGFLSKARSRLVKRKHLNYLAEKIGIQSILVSNTDNANGIKYIYGDALEALIGAIYLDRGYKRTRDFILKRLLLQFVDLDDMLHTESDYKSRIIEWAQKYRKPIAFESRETYSGSSKIPLFVATVKMGDENLGTGQGSSKKEAEQNAAEVAFLKYCLDYKSDPDA